MQEKNLLGNEFYTVTKDFKLVSFNQVVKDTYPDAQVGAYCYASLMHKDSPCLHCPLAGKIESDLPAYYNPINKNWMEPVFSQINETEYAVIWRVVDERVLRQKSIIQSITKLYYSSYFVNLEDDTYTEITSLDQIRRAVQISGSASEGREKMCANLIHEDFVDEVRSFTDFSTLDQRMVDTDVISMQFISLTNGWSQAFFIAGDRNTNGRLKSVIFCTRSIIKEKEQEEAHARLLLEAKEASEAANLSKTIFLSNMSHDIRTPMNAILGYAKLMEKEVDNPAVVAEYLQKIQSSGDFLLTIINNVLEIARIDSGKTEIDYEFMDIKEEGSVIFSLFGETLKKKKLRFTSHVDIQHNYVLADISKTRQIMMNIMSNAVKYTPDSGMIDMETVELPSENPEFARYRIRIQDSGIGMSQEFLDTIFEEFTRERNTTESKIVGTGLGMSIVKKLVELLGGSIEIESQLGVGTTITLYIVNRIVNNPDVYLAQPDMAKTSAVQFKGKRILLAEDNELNAEIAKAILEDAGFFVDVAADGVICVDMLTKSAPGFYDLIFMDVQMPNMDGYKATQAIRRLSDEVKKHIPIVAMTANAFVEDKKKAFEAGMNGHLAKPIDVDELMKMLAEIFSYKYV